MKLLLILILTTTFSACGAGRGVHQGFAPGQEADLPLSYQAAVPDSLLITKLATVLAPTRLKITSDGSLMFVALQEGKVLLFRKQQDTWVQQTVPFFDLGELNAPLEGGLTGLFFGAGFDPESSDPIKREIFLNYQTLDGREFRNRITRVTLIDNGEIQIGVNPIIIYQGHEPSAAAHQIEDGVGFYYEGQPHILVVLGDGLVPSHALDPAVEGHGKLLLMQRNGLDPPGPRPFPESPKVQAIGIRNPYGIVLLPEALDPRRRLLGVEAGNDSNDRIWLVEAVDFGHERDEPANLGYTGDDTDASWLSVPDVNAPDGPIPEAVLTALHPVITPMCIDLHPGGGIIPEPGGGRVVFLVTYLGTIGSTDNEPGKKVMLGVIDDLGSQPTLSLTPLIERRPEAEGSFGNTSALAVDPTNGDIFFADIITGELNWAVLQFAN